DSFCLDLTNECLWEAGHAVKLRPKAFAVLEFLLRHPGRLVTKEELLNAVWPKTFIAEGVLKVAIRQLRGVLGDVPKSPRYIETAHRRGYRLICHIAESEPLQAKDQESKRSHTLLGLTTLPPHSPPRFVGRDEALSRMGSWLEKMLAGERQ